MTFAIDLLVKVNHTAKLRIKGLENKLYIAMGGVAKSYHNEECMHRLQKFMVFFFFCHLLHLIGS